MLPVFETVCGSLPTSPAEVLKELGYADPEELREMRLAEEIKNDPRVREEMFSQLRRIFEKLTGRPSNTPIVVQKLKDKPQPQWKRVDKRQPRRYNKSRLTTQKGFVFTPTWDYEISYEHMTMPYEAVKVEGGEVVEKPGVEVPVYTGLMFDNAFALQQSLGMKPKSSLRVVAIYV